MRYALHNFTKTVSEDGRDVEMTGYSLAGREHTVTVKLADINRWLNGELIQYAFPYLTADERELCISGIDGYHWNKMFAEDHDD